MKTLYHMCSIETLKRICDQNSKGYLTLGLSYMSPCGDLNDELINRIFNLKKSLFSHMGDLINNYKEKNNIEESNIYRAIQLLYNYPYLFSRSDEFQIYSLSLMSDEGLGDKTNWEKYADDGRGVAIALDFSANIFTAEDPLIQERERIYGKEACYVQDSKNQKLIGILSAVSSIKLQDDEAYNKFLQDIKDGKSCYRTGLSYALNDLYQKPEGHERDHEYRLSCILTKSNTYKELLQQRGIIHIENDNGIKYTYSLANHKKLLPFLITNKCIKKILVRDEMIDEDSIKTILKQANISVEIEHYLKDYKR